MSVAALSMLGSFDAFLPGNAKHAKPKWSSALAAGVSPMEEMLEQLKAVQRACAQAAERAGPSIAPSAAPSAAGALTGGRLVRAEPASDDQRATPAEHLRVEGNPDASASVMSGAMLADAGETQARVGAQASAGEGTGGTIADADSSADDHDNSADARPKLSRAEQSRVNGAKSRGPVSAEGKAASSQNAYKHGLCAQGILVPGEDPAEFERFRADFIRELRPDGTVQTTLVRRSAELAWKLKRMPVVESAILGSFEHDLTDIGGMGDLLHQLMGQEKDGVLIRLQRYETRLEKSLQACLRELRQLKADAEKEREREKEREQAREREKTSAVTRVSSPVPGAVEREPVQMGSKTRDRSDALVGGFVSAGGSRVGTPCHEKAACGFTDQAARKAAGGSGSFGQNGSRPDYASAEQTSFRSGVADDVV